MTDKHFQKQTSQFSFNAVTDTLIDQDGIQMYTGSGDVGSTSKSLTYNKILKVLDVMKGA